MTVRAKFKCNELIKRTGWEKENPFLYAAKFSAVSSGSEENKSFFAATPSGNIEVSTVKNDVFEVGKEYYIDFTPAE
jgi:hypothetical protein